MIEILPCLIHFLQPFKYAVSLPNKDDVEAIYPISLALSFLYAHYLL